MILGYGKKNQYLWEINNRWVFHSVKLAVRSEPDRPGAGQLRGF